MTDDERGDTPADRGHTRREVHEPAADRTRTTDGGETSEEPPDAERPGEVTPDGEGPTADPDGLLAGKNVVLGIAGSIAAVKTVELAHELRRHGAAVRAVMTESARGILHPWAVEFATGHQPVTEITGRVEHVELCGRDGWADVVLLAPATANTVGKVAGAIDDTPVTTCVTTALGAGVPVVCAPAMHEPMYDHPGVLRALDTLDEWGVRFVDPRIEEGKAKIATTDAIVTETGRAAGDRPLADRHVIVTAGATSETIDPVRVLTNRASGKTGRAVARACYVAGADVSLLHDGPTVTYADTHRVSSAAEMTERAVSLAPAADALVSAAAIADYTVTASDEKIRSGEESLTLELRPTRKLLDAVRDTAPEITLVGFKAESSGDDAALVDRARAVAERVDAAFVVANDASVMGDDDTRALFVRDDERGDSKRAGDERGGEESEPYHGSKIGLGKRVARELVRELA